MTNEEAIEFIKTDISRLWDTPQNRLYKEAYEMAIKALSEQIHVSEMTNEEAIKHVEDMKKGVFLFQPDELYDTIINALMKEPKTGQWIFCENSYWKEVYKCSECNEEITKTGCWNHRWKLEKYCPNCGAKMK